MTTFSRNLFLELELLVKEFPLVAYGRRSHFIGFLCMQEQIMRASEELMSLASNRAAHPYFRVHLEEERGHAKWIRNDLFQMGVVAARAPLSIEVTKLVGMQYYYILQDDPYALLGYLLLLEGFPAKPEIVRAIREMYPEASHTIAYHAKHDVDHRADLLAMLDEVDPQHHAGIRANALESAKLYHSALWRMTMFANMKENKNVRDE